MTIETFATADDLADAAAGRVAGWLNAGLAAREQVSLVVPGGRTPAAFLARLAKAELAWPRVRVTLSDERWVPPTDPGSNEALIRRTLLQGSAAAAAFLPLYTDAPSPAEGAAEVERRLAALPLPIEVVVVGMGEDGHFASLFPGEPVLAAALDPRGEARCVAARGPADGPPRLSLTFSMLTRAHRIVVLATGETKRRLWQDGLSGGRAPPVAALQRQDAVPIFFLWSP